MQATLTTQGTIAGVSFTATMQRTADLALPYSPETPLPAAEIGVITRSDANTGVVTLGTGHGIVNGKVDVYWNGGLRYGMDATVNVNTVTVDGGAGDDLPADAATAVTVAQQVAVDLADFNGNKLVMLAIYMQRRGHVDFRESATSALPREQAADEVYTWVAGTGVANPLAGKNVEMIVISNGDPAGSSQIKIGMLLNSAA